MDPLLDRLWELANEDDDRRDDRVAEAQALWRALEVLLSSLRPQQLNVGDGAFTKTLACIRSVLSDPNYWEISPSSINPSDTTDLSTVFASVNRVLLKIGFRGEQERAALVQDGVADLIVRCGDTQPLQKEFSLSSIDTAAALQTLQTLALDAKNRASLQVSHTIRFCVQLLQKYESVFSVQLRGCQFLHQMTLEEECKERILRHGGLQVVTDALARFAEEAELVIIALDVLFFLCVELEYREDLNPSFRSRSIDTSSLQRVVSAVVEAMHVLQSVELVQANGVGVLNCVVMHSPAKQLLCSLNIWDIAENGLSATATNEAACDFVAMLDSILRDPVAYESLRKVVRSATEQGRSLSKSRLKALKSQVEALRHSQVGSKENGAQMIFVASRLQKLMDEENSEVGAVLHKHVRFGDDFKKNELAYVQTHLADQLFAGEEDSGDELPVDSSARLGYAHGTLADDTDDLLIGGGTEYFENFLRDEQARHPVIATPRHALDVSRSAVVKTSTVTMPSVDPCTTCSTRAKQMDNKIDNIQKDSDRCALLASTTSTPEAENWQPLYEGSVREVLRMQNAFRELEERYHVVLRRSQEQTKLLALQQTRLASHSNEQQQVLQRMHSLESSLDAAESRCQVERALRSAEAAQSEQLSLALNESLRETKSLTAQQSSAARELQQKETMRTEYMMRSQESKHDKQRVEIERDNALIQIEILKQQNREILQKLTDCRREGLETLLMREEDVDARRPGIFTELARAAVVQNPSQRPQVCAMPRRNSLPANGFVPASQSAFDRPASVHPISTQQRGIDVDLNDDPNSIDTSEIHSCLTSIFQSLDASGEGPTDGVHVATVRRFFIESGLVQPPNMLPADVDVVLASVLAQLNRKNSLVRKDFESTLQEPWAPPVGWAKKKKETSTKSVSNATGDATRFRFFNQDAFNEAVTLIGMRRFPRSDLLSALQTVVALYFRPYLRQQRTLLVSTTSRRSSSISTNGSGRRSSLSMNSPSQVCTRAMKTILNGLALHLGNDNEHRRNNRNAGIDGRELRCHSLPPSAMNRSHKREDVVYSMLEMNGVLTREQRPLGTICEFYSSQHLSNVAIAANVSITKSELFGLSFEFVLNFAVDFELIPAFMDRVCLKHLHTEVAGLLKSFFALYDKDLPSGADAETLKKVAFGMILARLALELFSAKPNYDTPEQQITGLLQWLDNSPGREKIMKKAGIPLVIRFSRQLYSTKTLSTNM